MSSLESPARLILACLLLSLAAACNQVISAERSPSQGYRYLELLLDDPFDSQGEWRSYTADNLFLGLRDRSFQIDFIGRKYVWTQGDSEFADVVVEAELTQTSDYDHNAFGLACRLEPSNSGRGYFFLISGDGFASIRWSNGRSLEPIFASQPAEFIKRGRATNRIRAVCIGDYLALWVNDEFVAEARDRRASSGAVGMVGVMNYEGKPLTVEIDDLKIWRASFDDRAP